MDKSFKWLHFSDVHVGLNAFAWQWPTMKAQFFDDLEEVHDLTGSWDLVVFSGDLVQSGAKEEYANFTQLLQESWERFDKLGCKPKLLTVPGNHDLVRSSPGNSQTIALGQWWAQPSSSKESVRNIFWGSENNEYRNFIQDVFHNYMEWQDQARSSGIPLLMGEKGLLPGDSAVTLSNDGLKIGLIGLNSSYLQLTGADFDKRLSLDSRQLLALTNQDPHKWAKSHDLTLLVTHHPFSWLHKDSFENYESEIYSPRIFDAHLFGHMHESNATTIATIGSTARRYMQAPSLFGLERANDGRIERIHGYTATSFTSNQNESIWRFWPRIARRQKDGEYRPVPDYDFKLNKEQCVIESTSARNSTANADTPPSSLLKLSISEVEKGFQAKQLLGTARFQLPQSPEQINVRVLAQESCVAAVQAKRFAWLDAEWGMNLDGFIWTVLRHLGVERNSTYRIDAGKFHAMQQFLPLVAEHLGCSFATFCKALSEEKAANLIFDDVPAEHAHKFLEFMQVVLDFCPNLFVFIKSRGTKRELVGDFQPIKGLDEIETKTYIYDHPQSTEEIKNTFAVSEIYRISDGLPSEIDRAIRKLRFVPIADLGASFFLDSAQSPKIDKEAPGGLVRAVSSIIGAEDPYVQRAFYLLKILTVLPYGESIRRLRHFDPTLPLFDQQAEELIERSLVEPRISVQMIGNSVNPNERSKVLVATRSVRDYVRTLMGADEEEKLTNLAMRLYFGEKWRDGEPKFKWAEGFSTIEDGTIFHNPHSLLLKLLGAAVNSSSTPQIANIVTLCNSYAASLLKADHFRSLATVSRDVLRILPDGYDSKIINSFELYLARALRMIGEHDEAISLLRELKKIPWDKQHRKSVLINLALCLESADDEEAIEIAKEIIKLDPDSSHGLQAKAIILSAGSEDGRKMRLKRLEVQARRRGKIAVANNLAIERAEDLTDSRQVEEILDEVIKSAKAANDWYNVHRAVVEIAVRMVDDGRSLPSERLRAVVSAYHYCYAQRFQALFRDAHYVLWSYFEKSNDVRSLLNLFRQSSFVWRLSSNESVEQKYLKKLISKSSQLLEKNILLADQDTAYFILRTRNMKR